MKKNTETNYFFNYYELVLSRILSGATKLYPHQTSALLALHQKAMRGEMDSVDRKAGLILAGVGTGKTLIQAVTPYILAPWMKGKQTLYLSDNCTLRSRFLKDFPTTPQGEPIYTEWLLYSLDILPPGVPPPRIIELDTNNFNSYAFLMDSADMLVGNRQFVLNMVNRGDINPDRIGLLVVDEAHYTAASSYRTISNYFERSLLTYFTGSKFRSDSQQLPHVKYEATPENNKTEDDPVDIETYAPKAEFEFTLQDAWKLDPPPIKRITFKEARAGKFLVEEDGKEHEYDFEEFLAKATSDRLWFRRILLANNFCLPVLEKAVSVLLDKRKKTGQPHAMIVRALNIPHVHRIASLLEEKFPSLKGKVGKIHSKHGDYDLSGRPNNIVKRFYDGDLWVLVHCGTIGVGFDHKWASVSCCLCVFKTLQPAEQEWGRIIRKVPGPIPEERQVELDAANQGVVITHAALRMEKLFKQFKNGKKADIIIDTPVQPRTRPVLTTTYEAGETVLNLTDTKHLRPGDVLELSVLVDAPPPSDQLGNAAGDNNSNQTESQKSVLDSINNIDPEFIERIEKAYAQDIAPELKDNNALVPPVFGDVGVNGASTSKPWEVEVNHIIDRLQPIKETRVYQIQVESVLDDRTVAVVPSWRDIPTGAKLDRTRRTIVEPDANFLNHIDLDWQILIDDELIPYSEYKKRVVIKNKGLELNANGDICANGVSLKLTLPAAAYETFLKGLEVEIADAVVEVPHSSGAIARPDVARQSMSDKYGGQIRGLIYDLLKNSYLLPDGGKGKSLVDRPTSLLVEAIDRARESGNDPNFKNNSQLIHSAVFGYIKDTTGRTFAEHDERQYIEAKNLGKSYLGKLQLQLQRRIKLNKKFS